MNPTTPHKPVPQGVLAKLAALRRESAADIAYREEVSTREAMRAAQEWAARKAETQCRVDGYCNARGWLAGMNTALTTLPQATSLTMSSLEIADLVDSRHDNVKRAIERLAEKGVISQPPLEDGPKSANGMTTQVYQIGKRDSYVIVAQLSPEFTARLVDRWQKLEAQVAAAAPVPAIPNFLDPAISARAWADQYEARNQAEAALELAAPKVQFFDRYVDSTGLKGIREVAKLLKANEREFIDHLIDTKVMYRLAGVLTAHQNHINARRFVVKAGTSETTGHAYNRTLFTPRGVEWIAGLWAVHTLREEART